MFTVNKIAEMMKGEIIGDGSVQIKDIKHPEFASEGDMTFAMDKKSLDIALASNASCVMTTFREAACKKTLLYVNDIKSAVTMLYNILLDLKQTSRGLVHPAAVIAKSAVLGKEVTVDANAVIGENVRIGDNTTIGAGCVISANAVIGARCFIFPNVTIYEHTVIRDKVMIHSGTVIGADGFGYVPKDGKIYKVPQMGRVVIEEGVEIGANSCVDRGTFDTTVIGKNSKLDNMVQIAHNVKIGERVMMAAQTGIGGTSTIGDDTMMGGQVGITDHVKVGRNVKIGAQSGVLARKVKDDAVLFGYPARDAKEYMKKDALTYRLLKNADKIWKFFKS